MKLNDIEYDIASMSSERFRCGKVVRTLVLRDKTGDTEITVITTKKLEKLNLKGNYEDQTKPLHKVEVDGGGQERGDSSAIG